MPEQLPARIKIIADANLVLELTKNLRKDQANYPDRQFEQITSFLADTIWDTATRLANETAFLEFQIRNGMI